MWKIQESNGKLGLCPLFGVIMKLFSRLIPITAIMGCSPQPRPDLKIKYLAIAINIAGQGGRLGGGGLSAIAPITVRVSGCRGLCIQPKQLQSIRCTRIVRHLTIFASISEVFVLLLLKVVELCIRILK